MGGFYGTCKQCGKKFFIPACDTWVYKRGETVYFCTWGCMRTFDRIKEKEKERKQKEREAKLIFRKRMGKRGPAD